MSREKKFTQDTEYTKQCDDVSVLDWLKSEKNNSGIIEPRSKLEVRYLNYLMTKYADEDCKSSRVLDE